MPNPTEINLLNYHFEAVACNEVLTVMLNKSDKDYSTVDELSKDTELSLFSYEKIRDAVYELHKRGFLLEVKKPYGYVYKMKMNSPYMGKFKVTQAYKRDSVHDGLDLAGIDSKEIHATISGTVHYAGWENSADHSQGFGQYVCIKGSDGRYYYYGHLSQIKVKSGQSVKITDVIGIEGSTGKSTGSHCHYCIRPAFCKGNSFNVSQISGIPNSLSTYDDGDRPGAAATAKRTKPVALTIDGVAYEGTLTEK